MKRFWWTISVIVVLVGGFLLVSSCMAVQNKRSITDEWRSWLPAEEVVKKEVEPANTLEMVVYVENLDNVA